ncbi:MAG: TonB-dependent receptor [Bacteroidales bacterium]|nr:TonB-dependent receptor [Bacteroidales bacterium]
MMFFSKKFLFPAMLALLSFSATAQNVSVKGRVTDSDGEGVIAATVYQADKTSNGTVTDADGNYTISVPAKATLVISCLGYQDAQEAVGGRKVINVVLQNDDLTLDAAQVVTDGYTSVAKRDLTGSVSSVDMDAIVKAPVATFDQALTGRVAGVVVSTSDGAVGQGAEIVIRGNNSLTQSSEPLYIIDGFPSESSMATVLNSADIETIDILKDASATAIYGARGANGVVVITTKRGAVGKPVVNFSATFTGNTIANKVKLMDAYEFVRLQTDYSQATGGFNSYLDGYTLEDYRNVQGIDWQDRIYRTALVQNYNLSVSGGNKDSGTIYNASFSALSQDGIIVNSNFSRYQGKVNLTQKITSKLELSLQVNYSHSVTSGTNPTAAQQSSSASGWLMYSVWGYRPSRPLKYAGEGDDDWADGLIDTDVASSNDYRFNPAKTVRNEYKRNLQDYLTANASLVWQILPELKLKISGGYTMQKRRNEAFNGTETYSGYEGSPSGKGINGFIYWYDTRSWLNDYVLTWNKTFNRAHHLVLTGIFSMQGQKYDFYGTSATRMTTEALGLKGLHTGEYQTVTPFEYNWRLISGAFRVNYNYKYKYYLTASFRADASSKFPKHNRVGYFPSASLAWNFNREDFLKKCSWLSNGKLRFSWGLTGNNRTSTPYDFYSQITTLPGNPESFDYVFDGKSIAGYFPANMANDNLKWETTSQYDLGLDLAFLDNRIKFTGDVYLKNTYNLLLQATIPASSGFITEMLNVGSMENKGLELTLEVVPIRTRDWEWSINVNMAMNRNKVTALTDNQYSLLRSVSWDSQFNSQYPYITQVGKPSGMMYGYLYEGTYKNSDFNAAGLLKEGVPYMTSVGRVNTKPGDPKYADINQDGEVNENDRTIIGCGQPLHTGGFGSNLTWKGLDFSFFFAWSYGQNVLNANRLIFENGSRSNLNQFRSYQNRFDAQTNPDSDIPRVAASGMDVYSSRVVEDGSFLRMKNITLGYSLPARILRHIRASNLRVYISGENLFTITRYSGPDPEVSTRNSVLTPGFDWSAYARAIGFTGGINITF